jgi:hypothetical protein
MPAQEAAQHSPFGLSIKRSNKKTPILQKQAGTKHRQAYSHRRKHPARLFWYYPNPMKAVFTSVLTLNLPQKKIKLNTLRRKTRPRPLQAVVCT